MKSQVVSVVECVINELKNNGIDYELGGEISVKSLLTPEMLINIRSQILIGFNNNEISMTEKSKLKNNTEQLMKTYVSGLVNNWIRKYKPFNNGVQYITKNPGIRKGSGDEQVREMKKLLKTITDQSTRDKIQNAIDKRIEEIKPTPSLTINVESLPEHLRHLV